MDVSLAKYLAPIHCPAGLPMTCFCFSWKMTEEHRNMHTWSNSVAERTRHWRR